MSKRSKLVIAGLATALAASLGVAAPAVGSSVDNGRVIPLMDGNWCC